MRISGTEPSSVILSQTNKVILKVDKWCPNIPKQAVQAKRDGVINPQNYNFNQFCTENFILSKRYELKVHSRAQNLISVGKKVLP